MYKSGKLKIKANCSKHAEKIQKAMFDLGMRFSGGGICFRRLDARMIFVGSFTDGQITVLDGNCLYDDDHYNEHKGREVTLKDLIKMKKHV